MKTPGYFSIIRCSRHASSYEGHQSQVSETERERGLKRTLTASARTCAPSLLRPNSFSSLTALSFASCTRFSTKSNTVAYSVLRGDTISPTVAWMRTLKFGQDVSDSDKPFKSFSRVASGRTVDASALLMDVAAFHRILGVFGDERETSKVSTMSGRMSEGMASI